MLVRPGNWTLDLSFDIPALYGKCAYNKSYDYINDDNDHDNDDIIPINLSFTFRTLSDNPIKTIEPGAFSFGVSSNTRM